MVNNGKSQIIDSITYNDRTIKNPISENRWMNVERNKKNTHLRFRLILYTI